MFFPNKYIKTFHKVGNDGWDLANAYIGSIFKNYFSENDRLHKKKHTNLRKPCVVTANGRNFSTQKRMVIDKEKRYKTLNEAKLSENITKNHQVFSKEEWRTNKPLHPASE